MVLKACLLKLLSLMFLSFGDHLLLVIIPLIFVCPFSIIFVWLLASDITYQHCSEFLLLCYNVAYSLTLAEILEEKYNELVCLSSSIIPYGKECCSIILISFGLIYILFVLSSLNIPSFLYNFLPSCCRVVWITTC